MAFSNFVAFNHFFDFENFHFQKTYENLVKKFFTFKIISLKMNEKVSIAWNIIST